MKHHLIKDRFSPLASRLRGHFESRFEDPHRAEAGRFVWDFWNVPGQYRLVRTPAYHYFPQRLYQEFHSSLVQWGRENLGCHDVSPTWLSYYVDGCRQELHSDVPHGPWAFVFSLTPKARRFEGGETMILRPQLLSYWSNFTESSGHEQDSFVEKIPSNFNRLLVFDPRLPHGVTPVRGVEDPRQARLVIHGWFVEPRPYVVGPLSTAKVQKSLERAMELLQEALLSVGDLHGTVSLRLKVSPQGRVADFGFLTNTLIGLQDHRTQRRIIDRLLKQIFKGLVFPKASKPSKVVIPLLFK